MRDGKLKFRQLCLRARRSRRPAFSTFQFGRQALCLFFARAQLLLKIGHELSCCNNLVAGGAQHRTDITLRSRLLSYRRHLAGGTLYQIES